MNLRERIDRLIKLLAPCSDSTFADFQAAFIEADPARQEVYDQAVARHHSTRFGVLLRKDLELRQAVEKWCTSIPGRLIRLPASRLITVPYPRSLVPSVPDCKILVMPQRREDGNEFVQLWRTEQTVREAPAAEASHA